MLLMSCEVVKRGRDFFLMTFSNLLRRKVKRLEDFSERRKNKPTFYKADTISYILYPFRSLIRDSIQFIIFSAYITLNLVN